MPWTVEQIENDLLRSNIDVIAIPSEDVLEAVNRADSILGAEWIAREIRAARGLAPAMQIIGMGLGLKSLDGLMGSDKLIQDLRRGDQDADAELTAIHLFRSASPNSEVDLYPAVGTRVADFRVRIDPNAPWTTVEVTRPNHSKEQQRLERILKIIAAAVEKAENQFSLSVVFLREPTEDEVRILTDKLPEFARVAGAQTARLVDGMGYLLLNQIEVGRVALPEVPELADIPSIGLAVLYGGGQGGTVHHQISVQIPYTDERAENILRREARQLPPEGSGLVMLDVPHNGEKLRSWTSLIERRFSPSHHTRVSGVVLFSAGMVPVGDRYGWMTQAKLVLNPHAKVQLPESIQERIKAVGEQFDRVATEWGRRS